ncbi:unnamed protein product [Clonostachys solani]|uniref:Uncharacterized protein n=1 Tax=Clonostachys solani TaxID=160281 RepID=A0A9N9WA64_9HYPO|nr:unnamed protein product [Clonostachys solani]
MHRYYGPGNPLRDASFHASRLRDPPPPMELKSVQDLLRMPNEEMDRYISKYFEYYGDLDITAGGGTDGIPQRHVDRLQEEIRDCKKRHGRHISKWSIVIHGGLLGQLDERLQEVADKGQIPTWKPHTGVSPSPEPETPMLWCRKGLSKDKEIEKRQRAWYMENRNRLEEDGGHSFVPVSVLRELKGKEELLIRVQCWRFALGIPKDRSSDVFEQQLATWEFFRRWQRYNRGLQDTGGFEEFAIHSWRKNRFMGTEADYNEFLEDIRSGSPSVLQEEWKQEQTLRAQLQEHWREDCESFDDYGAAVERRLAKHGIQKTFKPNIDARSQDPVTTWIEYLGHMFWVLDVHKEHLEEMLAENELYIATLTFEDRSLDRDDPDWEANLQKAQKGLDQAKETCQRFAARGRSKGSIFWQPHDLHQMRSMAACTGLLTEFIQLELPSVEKNARPPQKGLSTGASLGGATNAAQQIAAAAIQEGPEDSTYQPAPPQDVVSTQPTSPLDVSGNPTSKSLKRKGSFSEQSEHNTKSRKRSSGNGSQPAPAPRRSERIPEVQRRQAEKTQKAKEEEAKEAKKEEEAKKAKAEKKAMKLQVEREKKQAAKAAEAKAARAARAKAAKAAKAARVSKATNPRHTQPARRSTRVSKRPDRLGFS